MIKQQLPFISPERFTKHPVGAGPCAEHEISTRVWRRESGLHRRNCEVCATSRAPLPNTGLQTKPRRPCKFSLLMPLDVCEVPTAILVPSLTRGEQCTYLEIMQFCTIIVNKICTFLVYLELHRIEATGQNKGEWKQQWWHAGDRYVIALTCPSHTAQSPSRQINQPPARNVPSPVSSTC